MAVACLLIMLSITTVGANNFGANYLKHYLRALSSSSTSKTEPNACQITGASRTNISACNNNGTTVETDDFYTANVVVSFTEPPTSGNLSLTGTSLSLNNPLPTVPVSQLTGTTYTFTNVKFPANGATQQQMTIGFTAITCGANITFNNIASCSAPVCSISSVSLSNLVGCNSNGTMGGNASDDYYTLNVTVNFTNPPTTGTLGLTGASLSLNSPLPSVPVSSLTGTSYTFQNVKFPANGQASSFTAQFSANTACQKPVNNNTIVQSCSTPQCAITNVNLLNTQACNYNGTWENGTDDYYLIDVKVDYQNIPTTGTLNLSGAGILNSPQPSVAVSALTGTTSYTFTNVKFPANGQTVPFTVSFSALSTCAVNVNNTTSMPSCSTPQCSITSASLTNGVACNNNGTIGVPGDDYYMGDVVVTYVNPPATGNLAITGTLNNPSVPVSSLSGGTYTFPGVRFAANGLPSTFQVAFTASPNCTRTVQNSTIVQSCSEAQCAITNAEFLLSTVSCNNNGTINVPGDDYYVQNIKVYFSNPPTTGNLVIEGALNPNVVPVSSLVGVNNYTFNNVIFAANGQTSQITIRFSANTTCALILNNTTTVQPCSAPQCTIGNVSLANVVGCNNNGTMNGNASDDYYTADVVVNFTNPPTTGTLNLSGNSILNSPQPSVAVSSLTGTSYTFTGVRFPANGQASSFVVSFSGASCSSTITNNTIVQSCSVPPCSITNVQLTNADPCNNNGTPTNTADDFYTVDVVVTYANPPATGNLQLTNGASGSVPVSSLTGTTYTFQNVQFPANGQIIPFKVSFSALSTCAINVNNTGQIPSCSTGSANCSITAATLSNVSTCNNNGTSTNAADDYFTANVTVTYTNPPTSGNLILTGTANPTVPTVSVSSLTGGSYTFTGVRFPANGQNVSFTATFSAQTTCTLGVNTTTSVASCSAPACSISGITISNVSACNNNLTTTNAADDYYTANITVTYSNPPTTGSLVLSGSALNSPSVLVSSLTGTSYTFTGVRFVANGQSSTVIASFTSLPSCSYTIVNPNAIPSCSNAQCAITSTQIANVSACNNNGTLANNTSDDYYTANVSVIFSNPPTTGTLNLSGAGIVSSPLPSVAVSSLSGNSYTFSGVRFRANGQTSTYTASFSALSNCSYTATNTNAVPSCSAPVCAISGINLTNVGTCNNNGTTTTTTDDYYTVNVVVNYTNPPTTGTLNLSGVGIVSSPLPSIAVGSLNSSTSHTFVGVRLAANGQASQIVAAFSAVSTCGFQLNNNTTVQPCSAPQCSITNAQLSNISTCNNNATTTNAADDYYTANVTITFSNPPTTGTLNLGGTGIISSPLPSVAVSSLSGNSYTFTGVRFRANGQASSFTATFSALTSCTTNFTNNTIVQSCSATTGTCSIGSVYVLAPSICNNNGTPTNPADDYYTASVKIYFTNPPTTGTLNLSGANVLNSPAPSVAVSSLTGLTSYTFTGVRFPANGLATTFTVSFSALPTCTKNVTNITAVQSCSSGTATCSITNVSVNSFSGCNNNGTTTNNTDDYFTTNVVVSFTNPPTSGNLTLLGTFSATAPTVAVGALTGVTSYTFTGVRFKTGQTNTFTAQFTNNTSCSRTTTISTIVPACSTPQCSVGSVYLLNVSGCNNNGTPTNPADDYYTATVKVYFSTPPATGTLNLSGANILNSPQPSVAVSSLTGLTFYSFTGVKFPANNLSSVFTVSFSDAPGCAKTVTNITKVASCSQ